MNAPVAPRPASPRTARLINDLAAYELLLAHGPMTRAELGQRTGLSGPTVSDLLQRLEHDGILGAIGDAPTARRGPRARLYAVVPDRAYVVGVAVATREITAQVSDVTGATVGSSSIPLDANARADRLLHRVITNAAAEAGLEASALNRVVVGAPGLVDPDTGDLTVVHRLPRWPSTMLPGLRRLLTIPVTLENEVNVAGLAELHALQQRSASFALLWMDEGVSAALVINGALQRGHSGGAGEVSFLPLGNGQRLQDVLSSSAVLTLGRSHGWTGRDAFTLVQRAVDGGGAGATFLDALADQVALAAAAMCSVVDPGTVILGGRVGRIAGPALAERVAHRLREHLPLRTTVATTAVDGDPVLRGAIQVALAQLQQQTFA